MTDYKKLIIEILERIKEERCLKRIYNFICFIYLRGGD